MSTLKEKFRLAALLSVTLTTQHAQAVLPVINVSGMDTNRYAPGDTDTPNTISVAGSITAASPVISYVGSGANAGSHTTTNNGTIEDGTGGSPTIEVNNGGNDTGFIDLTNASGANINSNGSNPANAAIGVANGSTKSLILTNAGTITGTITFPNASANGNILTLPANANGTITGNVTGGTSNDTFTVSGGTLNGTLTPGSGNNTLNLTGGTVSGIITLGTGTDTINLGGTALSAGITGGSNNNIVVTADHNLANGAYTNINDITVSGGNLTVGQNISAGGTLTLNNSRKIILNANTLTSASAFTANGDIDFGGGDLTVTGNSATNAGTITATQNGTLTSNGFTNNANGTINASGNLFTLTPGMAITNNGAITFTGGSLTVTGNSATNAGTITATADGTLTSTGFTNNANGTINVNGNTLTLTPGAAVTNEGTVAFGGGSLTVTGNAFNHNGALNVTNTGTLTASTVTVGTAGKINVTGDNATLSTSAALVNNGTIKISGTTSGLTVGGGAALTNTGTLEIEKASTITATSITSSGGTLKLHLSSTSAPEVLTVSNGIDLSGSTLQVQFDANEFLKDGSSHEFIHANGGAVTNIDQISLVQSLNQNSLTLIPEAANGGHLNLRVQRPVLKEKDILKKDVSAQGVISAFSEHAGNNKITQSILIALENASEEELPKLIKQLTPAPNQASEAATTSVARQNINTVQHRLAALREGSQSGYITGDLLYGVQTWLRGFGQTAQQKQEELVEGFKSNTSGVALGFDKEIWPRHQLGLGVSFGSTKVKSKDSERDLVNIDSYQFSLYDSFTHKNIYADMFVGYTHNHFNRERIIEIGTVRTTTATKYNGTQIAAAVAVGWEHALNAIKITPEASFQVIYNRENGYTENGASAENLNISMHKKINQSYIPGVTVKVSRKVPLSMTKGTMDVFVKGGFNYDLGLRQATTSARFVGGSGFTLTSKEPIRGTHLFGAGLSWQKDDMGLNFMYNYEGHKNYHSQAVLLQFNKTW